ncbi:OLC1v1000955C1, partial [Oldenlandia corymbosa var. corymbosa]
IPSSSSGNDLHSASLNNDDTCYDISEDVISLSPIHHHPVFRRSTTEKNIPA